MKSRKAHLNSTCLFVNYILILFLGSQVLVTAKTVNWQGPAGSKIKEIRYFKKDAPPTPAPAAQAESAESVYSNVIDSPPEAGFVPWIVLAATDENIDAEITGDYSACESYYYIGNPPAGTDSRTDYIIGLYDSGASAHVIGYENAVQAGLYNPTYLTEHNFVEVSGVTGSVSAHVTHPYALFMDGLDALEPNAPGESEMVLPTTSGMVGEYNVST
ncbi:MAG: hypothetical protein ACYSU8_03455, partial [Planctomycetota bacterium]